MDRLKLLRARDVTLGALNQGLPFSKANKMPKGGKRHQTAYAPFGFNRTELLFGGA
jgi:hypothetical protein